MKNTINMILCLLFTLQAASGQDGFSEGPFNQLIIRGATLINGNGSPPVGPVDIVIENNRITWVDAVGYPGVAIDAGSRPQLKPGGREIQAEGMISVGRQRIVVLDVSQLAKSAGETQKSPSRQDLRLHPPAGQTVQ